MPQESSSDAKAAKSQYAAQRRQTENALLCRWQGVDKRSARDIPDCTKFDFQLSSWSCLTRAPATPTRPNHNLPRSAAKLKMHYCVGGWGWTSDRLGIFEIAPNLISSCRRGHASRELDSLVVASIYPSLTPTKIYSKVVCALSKCNSQTLMCSSFYYICSKPAFG